MGDSSLESQVELTENRHAQQNPKVLFGQGL